MYLEARNRTRETRLEERVNKQVADYVSSNAATPKGKGKDKSNPKGKGKEESPGKGTPKGAGKDSKGKEGKEGKKGTTYCAEYYTNAGCPNGDACKKYHPRRMGRCFRYKRVLEYKGVSYKGPKRVCKRTLCSNGVVGGGFDIYQGPRYTTLR
eukprot:6303332-Amphidinium_carterae.1